MSVFYIKVLRMREGEVKNSLLLQGCW